MQEDIVPVTTVRPEGEVEVVAVKYNENHKWGYFYGITPEEVVLIKSWDRVFSLFLEVRLMCFLEIDMTLPRTAALLSAPRTLLSRIQTHLRARLLGNPSNYESLCCMNRVPEPAAALNPDDLCRLSTIKRVESICWDYILFDKSEELFP